METKAVVDAICAILINLPEVDAIASGAEIKGYPLRAPTTFIECPDYEQPNGRQCSRLSRAEI